MASLVRLRFKAAKVCQRLGGPLFPSRRRAASYTAFLSSRGIPLSPFPRPTRASRRLLSNHDDAVRLCALCNPHLWSRKMAWDNCGAACCGRPRQREGGLGTVDAGQILGPYKPRVPRVALRRISVPPVSRSSRRPMSSRRVVDDGVRDEKDTLFEGAHERRDSHLKTVTALASYVGVARSLAAELEVLADFDMGVIDEAQEIVGSLLDRVGGQANDAVRTVRAQRNRMSRVRPASAPSTPAQVAIEVRGARWGREGRRCRTAHAQSWRCCRERGTRRHHVHPASQRLPSYAPSAKWDVSRARRSSPRVPMGHPGAQTASPTRLLDIP